MEEYDRIIIENEDISIVRISDSYFNNNNNNQLMINNQQGNSNIENFIINDKFLSQARSLSINNIENQDQNQGSISHSEIDNMHMSRFNEIQNQTQNENIDELYNTQSNSNYHYWIIGENVDVPYETLEDIESLSEDEDIRLIIDEDEIIVNASNEAQDQSQNQNEKQDIESLSEDEDIRLIIDEDEIIMNASNETQDQSQNQNEDIDQSQNQDVNVRENFNIAKHFNVMMEEIQKNKGKGHYPE